MLEVPVFNMDGERTGQREIDAAVLGGHVRPKLLKQAVVRFLSNQHQGTAATKSRGMVRGSTRKLYRQKGTGNARMGANRTCIRRGGGVAFAKGNQNPHRGFPKKMRRLARNNAILARINSGDVLIVEELGFEVPKTRHFASMLGALGADQGCVVAIAEGEKNVWLSGRNVPKTEVRRVTDLHGYEILRRKKVIFSLSAFEVLRGDPVRLRPAEAKSENE
ncbi:MAG: 50S ribosomal protein L4 [Phycisphaerae bacterium]|nr:50S ribosomal protein L4 [Phycisphaerae bacterium]